MWDQRPNIQTSKHMTYTYQQSSATLYSNKFIHFYLISVPDFLWPPLLKIIFIYFYLTEIY